MKFDFIVGNPPYNKSLHLKIINTVIKFLKPNGTGCFIHPARWLQDPLWKYKSNSDHRRFIGIVERLKDVKFISTDTMCEMFDITNNGDLMISTIGLEPIRKDLNVYNNLAKEAVECILKYSINHNLKSVDEENMRDGWRCQINEMIPLKFKKINGMSEYNRKRQCNIFSWNKENVFYDGFNKSGVDWPFTRKQTSDKKESGSPFPHSIKFNTEKEAYNFESSCNTNFYNNIMFILKFDMHTPLDFLPYMEDYSHHWTDDDYCEFFGKLGMSEECQKWMCRDVYDYRVKDFIEYINFD